MHRFDLPAGEDVLHWITSRSPTLVVTAVALTTLIVVSRWLRQAAALRKRRAICQLLPTDTFDPKPAEIAVFAGVLSRVHRATRRLGGARAHAVRIRYTAIDGELAMLLEGHDRARSLLSVDARYGQVEVLPPPPGDGEGDESGASPAPLDSEEPGHG